jgi:MscS family membrane protein
MRVLIIHMRSLYFFICFFLIHIQSALGQPSSTPIDSPRATVREFLQLSWQGKYDDASRYLILPTTDTPPEELARKLSVLLDRHLSLDVESLSSDPGGDVTDGLYSSERLGELPDKSNTMQPLLLQKRSGKGWAFSRATVALIDEWYERFENTWITERLPEGFLRPGPLGLLWWQWCAAVVFLLVGSVLGRFLGWLTRQVLSGLMSSLPGVWTENSHERMKRATNLFWCAALFSVAVIFIELSPPRTATIQRVLSAIMIATFFWGLSRFVRALGESEHIKQWMLQNPGMSALLPLMLSSARIVIVVLAVVVLISGFGYPVASIIAGLGIGGLALALAAQKTGEDLFGSLVIGLDKPFLVGDFVKIDNGVTGDIEEIGLRSTKIRTLDRTLVSIPNGKLAMMQIESFTARDRMRISCTLRLVYQTTTAQISQITKEIEAAIRAHPRTWQDLVIVRVQEFGDYSINIEVMSWMQTQDWIEFRQLREDVLMQFPSIIEKAGTHFAIPSQRIFLHDPPKIV